MTTKWFLVTMMIVIQPDNSVSVQRYESKKPLDTREQCSNFANELSDYPGFVSFTCVEKIIQEIKL